MKYVLRSMTEKKGRFFLLIISIALSTALLVACTGMVDIILSSLIGPQLESYEGRNIVINSTDKSFHFFSDEEMNFKGVKEDSVLKELYIGGKIVENVDTDQETMLNIIIHGRDKKYVNEKIITQGNLDNFKGKVCIISERVAEERNLELGDYMDVIVGGTTQRLLITAICGVSEVFYNDSSASFSMLAPYDYLSSDLNQVGNYNLIMANSSEETIQEGLDRFNKNNSLFQAQEIYDEEAIKEQLSSFTVILYIMLMVVVVMSALIIYSSFKLIITERLSIIGTFMSQGATAFKVKLILYLESFCYGFLGALFGNLLGIVGLHVINRITSPLKDYGIYGKVEIELHYIIAGTLFAVILSMISAYLPVRKISKLQVKDIILNDVRISQTMGWKKFIIGTALLVISIIVYCIKKERLGGAAGLFFVLSLAGVLLLFPKLIDLLSRVLYHLLRGKSRNVIYAINNLRTSRILLGNISLLIISLISIITIYSLANSMIDVVEDVYTEIEFDIEINNISNIRENEEEGTADYLVKELKKIGIKEKSINLLNYQHGELQDTKNEDVLYASLVGMDLDTYVNYNQYLQLDKKEYSQYIKDFKREDSGILITTVISKITDKKVGDSIVVMCQGLEKSLKITGIIDGKLYNNGYFALIKNTTLKEQYGIPFANTLTFTTDGDVGNVLNQIKPILRGGGATAITRDAMCKQNIENNEVIVKALSIFSYMAIIIAALGIVNNVSISFLQRKSEFAVLSSVGMEDVGRTKILFAESVASVTWAMAITSLFSIFGLKLLSIIVKVIGFDMIITLDYRSLPAIYLISLIIVLIATIPIYFKSKKLSIIQELKYE